MKYTSAPHFYNIVDQIRDIIVHLLIDAEQKDVEIIEELITKVKDKDEDLYDAISSVAMGDLYEELKWFEANDELSEEEEEMLETLESIEDNNGALFLFNDDFLLASQALECTYDKYVSCTESEAERLAKYNYMMHFHKEKLETINPYEKYEEVYFWLNGCQLGSKYNKKDFLKLYNYLDNYYDENELFKVYSEFMQYLRIVDPKLFMDAFVDISFDYYFWNKWLIETEKDHVVTKGQLEIIEAFEKDRSIQRLLDDNKIKKYLPRMLSDFVQFNEANDEIDKEKVIKAVDPIKTLKLEFNRKSDSQTS